MNSNNSTSVKKLEEIETKPTEIEEEGEDRINKFEDTESDHEEYILAKPKRIKIRARLIK